MKKCLSILLVMFLLIGTMTVGAAETIDATNFEAFEVTVSAIGSDGQGHTRFVVSGTDFPFTVDTENQLAGCLLNGTVTYTGGEGYSATIPFVNVAIFAQPLRGDGRVSLDFTLPGGYTVKQGDGAAYTFGLTLSPVANETNFTPFKINVTRTGTPGDNVTKRLIVKNNFGFTPAENELAGCLLNGTVTYTGSGSYSATVPFVNVPVSASLDRGDGTLNLDFAVPSGYSICFDGSQDSNYTWDLTVSPAPEAVDETDFKPAKLTVSGVGSDGAGHKRIVVAGTDFPFAVTRENQLQGCLISGTMEYIGSGDYSKIIYFTNVPVAAQPMRADGRVSLDFTLPTGFTMQEGNASVYTYNLTIAPARVIDATNFDPMHLKVARTGSDGKGAKRLISANYLGFEPTEDALKGCVLNGTVTYTGDGDYSAVVPFVNVPVTAQPVRTDGNIGIDFVVPAGYSICLNEGEDANYNYDLYLSVPGKIELVSAKMVDGKLAVALKNDSYGLTGNVLMIAVVYDSQGDMADVKSQNISLGANSETTITGITFDTNDWATGKVMIWNSFSTMIPIIETVDIQK